MSRGEADGGTNRPEARRHGVAIVCSAELEVGEEVGLPPRREVRCT